MSTHTIGLWLLLSAFGGSMAVGQLGSGSGVGIGSVAGTFASESPARPKGAPYSLVETRTTVKMLADGTTITEVEQWRRFRDSEGRQRTEIAKLKDGKFDVNHIQVQDPVGHTSIMLIPQIKRALVRHLPAPKAPTPEQIAAEASLAASYNISASQMDRYEAANGIEKLPPRTIAGLYAEGRRQTTVIPAGKIGNDREIKVVSESWTSPELNLYLEYKSDDPRSGKTTIVVSDVDRSEPAAALFQAPADYNVVDQNRRPTQ